MWRVLHAVVAAAFVGGATGYAHHSYSATYDVGRQVTLEGKLVQFIFRPTSMTSTSCRRFSTASP
jgi:hypothetical protein